MARSIRKGPHIDMKLLKKVHKMEEASSKSVIKTWARNSIILPDFVGHTFAGNNVRIAGNSGIGGNIKDNQTVQGIYAFNKQDFQRSYILFKRLPKIVDKINQIKKSLDNS